MRKRAWWTEDVTEELRKREAETKSGEFRSKDL